MPTPPLPRPRTRDELLASARKVHRRIERALDALDEGQLDAIDDVAALTRTVLAFGKGDKLLLRLVNGFELERPKIHVPPPANLRVPATTVIGPIPWEADAPDVRTRDVFEWVQYGSAAQLNGFSRQTWDKFINGYANDNGAHVSTTVRRELEAMSLFFGPTSNMADYLMRAAGVVAARSLGEVLARIDGESPKQSGLRPFHVGDLRIGQITIGEVAEGGGVSVDISGRHEEEMRLVAIPLADRTLTFTWTWDPGTQSGGLRIDSDQPLNGEISIYGTP